MNNQIKEEGLTDAYLLGKYDGIAEMLETYDVESIEELVSNSYSKGRADAIEEYKKKIEFEDKWLLACKVFDPNVGIAFKTLISYAEQLKEQK